MGNFFSISREDWSLHRQGQSDQQRHAEKIKEAIKQNLADSVSNESIITSDGRRMVKVPIKHLQEYRFRYNWDKQQHAGTGPGGSKAGDVLGRASSPQGGTGQGQGSGQGAGDGDGTDYYEAEITVDELGSMIFADLGLPNLDARKRPDLTTKQYQWNDVRPKGLQANIDKKRTILEALKNHKLHGGSGLPPGYQREDLRYKTWEVTFRPETSAVVLAMMDTSGSMGEFEKYIARGFFFWMVRFLRQKYERVEIVFLAHSTEAKEVTEHEFFTKGESGGTRCSSVYDLALKLIAERYPADQYNLYPFHFSDGDNLSSDNAKSVDLVNKLLDRCQLFGYGEIDAHAGSSYYRSATLHALFQREISHPRFIQTTIKDKSQVYDALRAFFGPEAMAKAEGERRA